jgi:hypothetical protein
MTPTAESATMTAKPTLDQSFAPTTPGLRRARLLVATVVAGLLVACGGNGGSLGTSTTTTTTAAPTTVTLQSTVTDGSTNPVSGATITVATQSATETASTSAQGQFSLTLSLSTLPPATSGTDVLVVVNKPGFQTQVVTLTQTQLRRGGTQTLDQIALQLQPLPPTKLAPAAGAVLTRLGDGVLSGHTASNQFLQGAVVPGQTTYTIDMGGFTALADPLDGTVSAAYPTMTLTGRFRGLQTDLCPSEIEVYQLSGSTRTTLATFGPATTPALPPSATDGTLSLITLDGISTSGLNVANGDLWVQLRAGDCDPSPTATDYDDFEFLDLTITFNAPTPP